MERKTCLLIHGMHRSGTSMMAGLLQLWGLDLGKNLMPANEFNEKGYFENIEIWRLNDSILSDLDADWNTTYRIEDAEQENLVEKYRPILKNIINHEFGDEWPIVIKDPRISVILPLWILMLKELQFSIHHIIMVRHPHEVKASLARREGYIQEKSLLLWQDHMLKASFYTKDDSRLFVDYNVLFDTLPNCIEKIQKKFQLHIDPEISQMEKFISKNLRHHEIKDRSEGDDKLQQTLLTYKFFKKLTIDGKCKESLHILDILYYAHIGSNGFNNILRDNEVKRETQKLTQLLTIQTDELRELKTDLERQHAQMNEVESRLEGYLGEITIKKARISDLQLRVEELDDEKSFLQTKIKKVERELETAFIELQAREEAVKLRIVEISNLDEKVKELSGNSIGLKNDLSHYTKELKRTQNDYRNQETLLHRILAENEDLRNSISFRLGRTILFPITFLAKAFSRNGRADKTRLWLLVKIMSKFLHSPLAFLRVLNADSLRILWRAIEEESPATIVNNLELRLRETRTTGNTEDIKANLDIQPRETGRKKVLYLSPNLPDFDTSSGGKRATEMIRLLAEEFDVVCFTKGDRPLKYITKLREVGAEVIDSNLSEVLFNKEDRFDSIICAWYYSFYSNAEVIKKYESAILIADTVDVHWVRESRSLGEIPTITKASIAKSKAREIEVYDRSDIIWAVTEADQSAVIEALPDADVRVVSNIHDIDLHKFKGVVGKSKVILFFGGYQHYPNILAVKILVDEIFPLIKEKIPDATIWLAGSKAPEEVKVLGRREGVRLIGFVEEENVEKLYGDAYMTIVPLRSGAGIKGKICQAIKYGLPIITNAIGNEGINLISEEEGFISESSEGMAKYAIEILQGKHNLDQITKAAKRKLLPLVEPDAVRKAMVQSIRPQISICIVTWNRLDLLKKCIESVLEGTMYPDYRILVHSNACSDGTRDYLEKLSKKDERIVPILSETNEVFVEPNNAMMKMFEGNDCVLLNNDTEVTTGWLTALHNAAYSSKKVGIAGSKILYPDGSLQEFGSELYADGTGRNIGKHDDPSKSEYQGMKKVGYVSGCAMFIKWSTILKIGVFDEAFHPCYCEDSDFCYTGWEQGIETVVTSDSIIYHHEGATSGRDTSSGFKAYQEVNMKKFLEKHGDQLKNGDILRMNSSILEEEIVDENRDVTTVNSFHIISNYKDYLGYRADMKEVYVRRKQEEDVLCNQNARILEVAGYNPLVKANVNYKVTRNSEGFINLRESLLCPVTKTNSRLRAAGIVVEHLIENFNIDGSSIYFTEQNTSFYKLFHKKYRDLVGSEFLDSNLVGGTIVDGLRHEDITKLSFPSESFRMVVCLEVLEHVPHYKRGLNEIYRCLEDGGYMVLSVPFVLNNERTLIRAKIDDQGVVHYLMPPEFHGDPVRGNDGILCYYHFGWDLLEDIRRIGFHGVNLYFIWSRSLGIVGGQDQFVIVAKK